MKAQYKHQFYQKNNWPHVDKKPFNMIFDLERTLIYLLIALPADQHVEA